LRAEALQRAATEIGWSKDDIALSFQIFKYSPKCHPKRRQVFMNGLPDYFKIHAKITMDNFVSHANNIIPWDLDISPTH
jgi:hypothetical protein